MAYPPAALPINRTNATPQLDTHAADHNAIGQAINDVVTELGANPSGAVADVGSRFDFQGIRSTIGGGVDRFTDFGGFIIQATSTVVALDSNGNALITFPHAFHITPIVLVSQGDYPARTLYLSSSSPNVNNFTVSAVVVNTGAPSANTTIRCNWIAIGARTS